MGAPRVVVVESDGWLLDLLEGGLRDGGFVAIRATAAEEALAVIRAAPPECCLIDVELPDEGGYALCSKLRLEPAPLSITPIALLARDDDLDAKTRAFEAGADVLLTRPFRLEEVVAQLHALVQLAHRMRARRNSLVESLGAGPPSAESASFRADLAEMPLASLLAILEIERKSGTVALRSREHRASLEIADGFVDVCTLDGKPTGALAVLREVLGWSEGQVTFRASAPRARPVDGRPARALLAEAQRPQLGERPSAAMRAASVARMGAIPPPPGQRRPLSLPRMPALEEQPTRRVDVPELRVEPVRKPPPAPPAREVRPGAPPRPDRRVEPDDEAPSTKRP